MTTPSTSNTALFALFSALLFSSTEILNYRKRLMIGVWMVVAVGYFVGGRISTQIEELWQQRNSNQQNSME